MSVNFDGAVDGFVVRIDLKSGPHIVESTSLSALSISVSDIGVEAHAGSANESVVVEGAVVAHLDVVAVDDLDGSTHVHGNLKMTSQPVARATWDNGKRHIAVFESRGSTVNCAIATHSNHAVVALLYRSCCEVAHPQLTSDKCHLHVETIVVDNLV